MSGECDHCGRFISRNLPEHIEQMDDQDFWQQLGQRIQQAHDKTDEGDVVLITLSISQDQFDYGSGLDRCISIDHRWGVNQVDKSREILDSVSDVILEFPNDGAIYIDQIRDELVGSL